MCIRIGKRIIVRKLIRVVKVRTLLPHSEMRATGAFLDFLGAIIQLPQKFPDQSRAANTGGFRNADLLNQNICLNKSLLVIWWEGNIKV